VEESAGLGSTLSRGLEESVIYPAVAEPRWYGFSPEQYAVEEREPGGPPGLKALVKAEDFS